MCAAAGRDRGTTSCLDAYGHTCETVLFFSFSFFLFLFFFSCFFLSPHFFLRMAWLLSGCDPGQTSRELERANLLPAADRGCDQGLCSCTTVNVTTGTPSAACSLSSPSPIRTTDRLEQLGGTNSNTIYLRISFFPSLFLPTYVLYVGPARTYFTSDNIPPTKSHQVTSSLPAIPSKSKQPNNQTTNPTSKKSNKQSNKSNQANPSPLSLTHLAP